MKAILSGVFGVFLLLSADYSKASMFGEENVILAQQLLAQLKTLTETQRLVSDTRNLVGSVNEGFSFVREGYEQVQALRRFNLNDFFYDVKQRLYYEFPELQEIEGDLIDIKNQSELIQNGEGIWKYSGRRDWEMSSLMRSYFSLGYQTMVTKNIFKNAFNKGVQNPSEVEMWVARRYEQTGQMSKMMLEKASFYALMKRAEEFSREAEERERQNIQLMTQTASYESQLRTEADLKEFTNLYKADLAERMKSKRRSKYRRRLVEKGLLDLVDGLVAPESK